MKRGDKEGCEPDGVTGTEAGEAARAGPGFAGGGGSAAASIAHLRTPTHFYTASPRRRTAGQLFGRYGEPYGLRCVPSTLRAFLCHLQCASYAHVLGRA